MQVVFVLHLQYSTISQKNAEFFVKISQKIRTGVAGHIPTGLGRIATVL
jgi:hypothetical protein